MYGYGYKYTASGSIGSNVNQNTDVDFSLSGTGADETDYVVRLHLHSGAESGEPQTGDVFLNNKFSDDFSDVAIYAGETKLDHYIHSHGNYELIFGKLGVNNIRHGNRIFARGLPVSGGGLGYSDDNGETWTLLISAANCDTLCGVNSDGYLFYCYSSGLYRSNDNITYSAFTKVLDLTMQGTLPASGTIFASSFIEDADGNLYCGRYQASYNCSIFKSIDSGLTWSEVYHSTITQHSHTLYVDPFQSGVIYAVFDGTAPAIIKTSNGGTTWVDAGSATIPLTSPNSQMTSSANYRFLIGERYGVIRTSDDITWSLCHFENADVNGIINIDGKIYATITSFTSGYRRIIMSEDEGSNWETIWIDKLRLNDVAINGLNDFYANLKRFNISGDEFICCDKFSEGEGNLPSARLYFEDKYTALAYVKIPALTADGITLTAKKEESSSTQVFTNVALSGVLLWLKCNEASGNQLLDSSGNNYHSADGTGTFSRNNYGIRKYGMLLPEIFSESHSLKLGTAAVARFILTGTGAVPALNTGKNLTIIIWIKGIVRDAAGLFHIFAKGAATGAYFGLYTDRNLGIYFRYSNGSATVDRSLNSILSVNVSKMIAVTISNDATPIMKAYINGELQRNENMSYAAVLDNTDWNVGGRGTGSIGLGCFADLQDIQMYNRPLSELEIYSLFEGRKISATEPDVI